MKQQPKVLKEYKKWLKKLSKLVPEESFRINQAIKDCTEYDSILFLERCLTCKLVEEVTPTYMVIYIISKETYMVVSVPMKDSAVRELTELYRTVSKFLCKTLDIPKEDTIPLLSKAFKGIYKEPVTLSNITR